MFLLSDSCVQDRQRRGLLNGCAQCNRLQALGFEFNEDEADWQRWYSELQAFKADKGHCNPDPLATGVDLCLYNWCAVQRVARRTRVLTAKRSEALTKLEFDWEASDPLS